MKNTEKIILSCIIVNYNTRDLLRDCLKSIYQDGSELLFEIIVIDNNSGDGTVEMIRKEFRDVILINNNINFGYASAVNQGLKIAAGDFFLVLNADIVILPNAIIEMLDYMRSNPQVGIVGPKLLYPDGRLQYSCRTFYNLKTVIFRRTILGRLFPDNQAVRKHLLLGWDHNSNREVDWVIGACMLIRRESVAQVGGMDEHYFLYLEDVDWCYRMKLHGWQVFYLSKPRIKHYYRRGSRLEKRWSPDLFAHLGSTIRYVDKWNKYIYAFRRYTRYWKHLLFIGCDVIIFYLSFRVAYLIRSRLDFLFDTPLYPPRIYVRIGWIATLTLLASFSLVGLHRLRIAKPWWKELFAVLKGVGIAICGLVLYLWISRDYQEGYLYSRFLTAAFLTITIILATGFRSFLKSLNRWLTVRRFNLVRVLIVGFDQTARDISRRLGEHPDLGYEVVGFVAFEDSADCKSGDQILGDTADLNILVEKENIREVILVNADDISERLAESLAKIRKKMISIRLVSNKFLPFLSAAKVEDFLGYSSISLSRSLRHLFSSSEKRWKKILNKES